MIIYNNIFRCELIHDPVKGVLMFFRKFTSRKAIRRLGDSILVYNIIYSVTQRKGILSNFQTNIRSVKLLNNQPVCCKVDT